MIITSCIQFECCGISGVSDWIMIPGIVEQGLTYPLSCCINTTNINCGEIGGLNTNSFTKVSVIYNTIIICI